MNHHHHHLIISLLILFSFATAHEKPEELEIQPFPRPLIVEYSEKINQQGSSDHDDELQLKCRSWRIMGEANNLSPWKTIPSECAEYIKNYMMGKAYTIDLEMVSKEAWDYAKTITLGDDGKDAWVFDIDETLLSNLPYYTQHQYGLEVFNSNEFDDWVAKAMAPAIDSSLNLYDEIRELGFKVFLLTGRSERHRSITVENLITAGFRDWDKLILRGVEDHGKTATVYKSEKRSEMLGDGYRIMGNSGDQWSDLIGSSLASRSFKLPNPMYYIP